MQKLFKTPNELFAFLISKYKIGDTVDIASFGMYLGFSKGKDWHKYYPVMARNFIEKTNISKTRILIGIGKFLPCDPFCENCLNAYNQKLSNYANTTESLKLNIKYSELFHMKMYRVGNIYVCGGINLGVSEWSDSAVIITDNNIKKELQDIFEKEWDCGCIDINKFKRR